jgi:hypothetical protein
MTNPAWEDITPPEAEERLNQVLKKLFFWRVGRITRKFQDMIHMCCCHTHS